MLTLTRDNSSGHPVHFYSFKGWTQCRQSKGSQCDRLVSKVQGNTRDRAGSRCWLNCDWLGASTPLLHREETSDLRGQLHYRLGSWSSRQLHGWGQRGSVGKRQVRTAWKEGTALCPAHRREWLHLRCPALQMRLVQVKLSKRTDQLTWIWINGSLQASGLKISSSFK